MSGSSPGMNSTFGGPNAIERSAVCGGVDVAVVTVNLKFML